MSVTCRFAWCVLRETHGEEDSYALACGIAHNYYISEHKYNKFRTFCLDDQETETAARRDPESLESLVWAMTRQGWDDRLHDIAEMRARLAKVTHM